MARSGRFRAFTFVDRISRCTPGVHIEGTYTVPSRVTHFPNSLMAEAVGQLAAWSAMARLDFAWRPVAGLAAESRYYAAVSPGAVLMLEADIARCDAEAVAYNGRATIDGRCALELFDCVGPMLPMEEFDSPDAVRADYATLQGNGVASGRFDGVPVPQVAITERVAGKQLRANLQVPQRDEAAYFDDHFPRRPVFPGTLLMDAFAKVALPFARECLQTQQVGVRNFTQVKIRSFTDPGAKLDLEIDLVDASDQQARMKLAARADGKTVATARLEVAAGGSS